MMTTETQDPLDELAHENEVAEKLVERLAETAIELKAGQDSRPGDIAEGLRLLEQYRRAHAERVDNDLKTEARPVAMSTCFEHLDTIASEHQGEGDRIERARKALEAYASDREGARARLSEALADLTEKKHQSLAYENDYPLSCLRAALPDEAAARVTTAFRRTDAEVADLEGHIERYLGRAEGTPPQALAVRCSHANCGASARSGVMPSNDGRFGMALPEGWHAISRPPVFGRDGTVRVNVEFCCPAHREEGSMAGEKALETWIGEGGSVPPKEETSGIESGTCCGLIPQDAR
jgi:hypothetical protein